MALTKEQIFAAEDLPREEVEVPEWGGVVIVRGLASGERDAWEAEAIHAREKKGDPLANFRARLVVRCSIGDDGSPLFDVSDVPRLSKKSSRAIIRIFDVACRLSGITSDDVAELEEQEKNSVVTGGSGGSTDSPVT